MTARECYPGGRHRYRERVEAEPSGEAVTGAPTSEPIAAPATAPICECLAVKMGIRPEQCAVLLVAALSGK